MKLLRTLLSGLFIFNFTTSGFAATTAPKAYTGEAAKVKTYLETLFDDSKLVNAEDASKKAKARKQIEDAMDWERLAKDCLGPKEWAKATPEQRKAYQNLLQEVIVKTAYTRLDTFWDGATYEFTRMDVKGNNLHSTAVFSAKGDTYTLDYFMTKKGPKWLIYDVALEDIRYSENIHDQIHAFLKEKGFQNLLTKLKERRDKLDADAKTTKKG